MSIVGIPKIVSEEVEMSKIRPLHTTRRVLTWLCLYPADKNTSKLTKLAYIIVSSIVFTTCLYCSASSIVYFMKYVSTDSEEALYALILCIGVLPLIIAILIAFALRHKITVIFEKLTNIYDERKKNLLRIFLNNIISFYSFH